MKRRKITYYLCIIMLVFSLALNAQENIDRKGKGKRQNPPNPHKPPPPHPELPIDGGLSYLIFAGIAYGIYELKKKK